ncbi:hypothetical protein ACVW17_000713 [Bradyrhizobium sp. USDA 4473]
MPTDWPRIQSTSKLRTVSTAVRRSAPVPWISSRLRGRVGADCARPGGEAVGQLQQGLGRHILQRNHRDAEAGFRIGRRGIDAAAADGVAERRQTIACRILEQHHAAEAERILKHENHVGFRHRADRHQAHRALHPRVDGVADMQDVAEHDLGDGRHRRALEIQVEAIAIRCRLRPRVDHRGDFAALIHRGADAAVLAALCPCQRVHLLRLARQQIQRAYLVGDVELGRIDAFADRRGIARRQQPH